ncbi:alpha/beta fold hydrolase [Tsukamurella pseudospumae]|uniref:Alpha/beta hydrolase n=1 Tax=Tsukamurella pseudospumae TaxID=239498 RepID=A0A137YX19_9ACTN|nr:alpha/beta hydrolase [Tsukamurella pseudospumae]KXO90490.1 alpha/beta hydrolase [Tsukamurella pseudospumae]
MPYAPSGDIDVYYETAGSGHPLFFVHGGGGNTMCWFQQVPYFAERYRVITVDLRGFKNSRCPPEQSHPRHYPDDILAIMNAEGIDRAAFCCQSLGAWAGLPLAARHPERVSALFINGSPTPAYSPQNWEVLRTAGDTFNAGHGGNRGGDDAAVGWNRTFVKEHPEVFFLYSRIKELNPGFDARTMQDDDIKLFPEDLAGFTTPTLMAGGSHDDFLTPTSHLHVATLIPGAVPHTFEESGHSAYFETPGEFNAVLESFLARHV